jgi:hypothetical protein
MARDLRLDVWRGLCLVDVVLVHLAFNGVGFPETLDAAIKHYTRFAAGGFVLLAGLTVATAFGPAVERSARERWEVYARLWRRAAWLVLATLAIEIAYRAIDGVRFYPHDTDTSFGEALVGILLFQRPGVLGGILVLYTILLALTPLLFEVQRRLGAAPITIASVLVYASANGLGESLVWPPTAFPVAFWQPLYVAGFLLAAARPKLLASHRRRVVWALCSAAAFAAIFVLQHGPAIGITLPPQLLALDFTKTPLRAGALLWYLATVQVLLAWTSLAGRHIEQGRLARALALLGRNSLLVYGAHVFTEIPALELSWGSSPPAWSTAVLAAGDLCALTLLCWLVERMRGLGRMRLLAAAWPRLTHAAATAVIAFAVASSTLQLAPSATREPTPGGSDAGDEVLEVAGENGATSASVQVADAIAEDGEGFTTVDLVSLGSKIDEPAPAADGEGAMDSGGVPADLHDRGGRDLANEPSAAEPGVAPLVDAVPMAFPGEAGESLDGGDTGGSTAPI